MINRTLSLLASLTLVASSLATTTVWSQSRQEDQNKTFINFRNMQIGEYIRFVSKITKKNFIFDENELDFTVTIVSEKAVPTSDVLTALIHQLRIKGFSILEQGNSLIIHKNPAINRPSHVQGDGSPQELSLSETDFITRVYLLNHITAEQLLPIVQPHLSQQSITEILAETQHLIVTDIAANIELLNQLVSALDSPASGFEIGRYVSRTLPIPSLTDLAQRVLTPIAEDRSIVIVPHTPSNSIFIISSRALVQRTINFFQQIDREGGETMLLNFLGSADPSAMEDGLFVESLQTDPILFHSNEEIPFEHPENLTRLLEHRGIQLIDGFPVVTPEDLEQFLSGQNLDNFENENFLGPGAIISEEAHEERFEKNILTKKLTEEEMLDFQGKLGAEADALWQEFATQLGLAAEDHPENKILETRQSDLFNLEDAPGGEEYQKELERLARLLEENDDDNDALVRSKGSQSLAYEGQVFYTYKLEHRTSDTVQGALQSIGNSLRSDKNADEDLINALNSVESIAESNTLVFTTSSLLLPKVLDMIQFVDQPPRQVLIEVLVLDTTINEGLTFGVSHGAQFSHPNAGINWGFNSTRQPNPALPTALSNVTTTAAPNPNDLTGDGFIFGAIGKYIIKGGSAFATTGSLVNALTTESSTKVLMNPQIVVEDNTEGRIVVGQNIAFPVQSAIAADDGSVFTQNFEYRDVGTTLRVKPLIGAGDSITLIISQEMSSTIDNQLAQQAESSTTATAQTTQKSLTETRLHVPNRAFVMMSGMIQDSKSEQRQQIPCLGSLPIIGAAFGETFNTDSRRNLIIFLRPVILDSRKEWMEITDKAQKEYELRSRKRFQSFERKNLFKALQLE